MLDTKRALIAAWGHKYVQWSWIYQLKRSDTLAAFSNCSLDDNPGIGMGDGDPAGQINGYLRFDPTTAVDEPERWEMTNWLACPDARGRGGPTANACTVDITPRRCRKFRPAPGRKFKWTNTLLSAGAAAPAGPAKPAQPAVPSARAGNEGLTLAGPKVAQTGTARADEHGLVTAKGVIITLGRHRIVIRR